MNNYFKPHHINATQADLMGNGDIGRYIFLPGSDGRAKEIANQFDAVEVKPHPRGHNLYLGYLTNNGKKIAVAAISSGMGCPSMEIILHELFHLGAKRFLRVGSAGSLQPDIIKLGDIINAQASVRDEHTTIDYVPHSVPAIASLEVTLAATLSAKKVGIEKHLHTGTVHCKSSFYARQFGAGPQAENNKTYINILKDCGILATEMETSTLFIQSQLYNHRLRCQGLGPQYRVLTGAILGILSMPPNLFASKEEERIMTDRVVSLALETVKTLASSEA